MPELGSEFINYLVGAVVIGAFTMLTWIAKRWVMTQEQAIEQLGHEVQRIDKDKVDRSDIQGLTNRLSKEQQAQTETIIKRIEIEFAESKKTRDKQSQQIEKLTNETQSLRVDFTERMTRVETQQADGNHNDR